MTAPGNIFQMIDAGDPATLAAIARHEMKRQVDQLNARSDGSRAGQAKNLWGEIIAWLEGARATLPDPAAAHHLADRTKAAVLKRWRTEPDHSNAHPVASHWFGLITLERILMLRAVLPDRAVQRAHNEEKAA